MANADTIRVAEPTCGAGAFGAATRARGVVLCRIRQNAQFLFYLHLPVLDERPCESVLKGLAANAANPGRNFFEISGVGVGM